MAILDIFEFNAVPTAQQTNRASGGVIMGAGGLCSNYASAAAQAVTAVEPSDNGTRWLNITAASAGTVNMRAGFAYPLASYVIDATKKFYSGFRFKRFNGSAAGGVTGFNYVLSIQLTGSINAQLLLQTDIPGYVNGSEYYVELMMDYPAGVYSIWVDGVLIKDKIAIPAVWFTYLQTYQPSLLFGHIGANTIALTDGTYFRLRDMYFKIVADVNDDYRLGPQILRRMPLKSIVGQDWIPATGKTLAASVSDLPAALTDYTDVTSYASSDANQHPGNLAFDLPANLLYPTAVIFDALAVRPTGTAGLIRAKVSDGVNSSDEKVTQLLTSTTQPARMAMMTKNLDGSKLTPAGIDAMDLIIQPSIS